MEKIDLIIKLEKIVYDVLWTDRKKNKKEFDKLKKLILKETKLKFTKEEFIHESFFGEHLLPFLVRDKKSFDAVDSYMFTFYEDTYDAIVSSFSDCQTIIRLEERIEEFQILVDIKYGIDNFISHD